jgi:hypothetical protein
MTNIRTSSDNDVLHIADPPESFGGATGAEVGRGGVVGILPAGGAASARSARTFFLKDSIENPRTLLPLLNPRSAIMRL